MKRPNWNLHPIECPSLMKGRLSWRCRVQTHFGWSDINDAWLFICRPPFLIPTRPWLDSSRQSGILGVIRPPVLLLNEYIDDRAARWPRRRRVVRSFSGGRRGVHVATYLGNASRLLFFVRAVDSGSARVPGGSHESQLPWQAKRQQLLTFQVSSLLSFDLHGGRVGVAWSSQAYTLDYSAPPASATSLPDSGGKRQASVIKKTGGATWDLKLYFHHPSISACLLFPRTGHCRYQPGVAIGD